MEQIRYEWTDGADKDFQRFYLATEEFYSSIVGGEKNRKGFIPYNISGEFPLRCLHGLRSEPQDSVFY